MPTLFEPIAKLSVNELYQKSIGQDKYIELDVLNETLCDEIITDETSINKECMIIF